LQWEEGWLSQLARLIMWKLRTQCSWFIRWHSRWLLREAEASLPVFAGGLGESFRTLFTGVQSRKSV